MLKDLVGVLAEPVPARFLALRLLDKALGFLSYKDKIRYNSVDRPHYGYGVHQAALLARKLGVKRISAIEFGVAGGEGLLALERHAELARRDTGVEVATYGFDTGAGLPPPEDVRDMPYLFEAGDYRMDVERLRRRLKSSKLILGDVARTVEGFCNREDPPPIGFVALDLDFYSSTAAALKILHAEHRFFLPRVVCYVDDMVGGAAEAYNEFAGPLLAIRDFNEGQERVKIASVVGLRHISKHLPQVWHEQVFIAHRFGHPDYNRPIEDPANTQLPLRGE
jgi:hypothetical protein